MFEPLLSDVKESRFYQEVAEEGGMKKAREIAKTMLKKRMSLKLVSEVTGLSQADLRALKRGLALRKN